jgi:hypothetical protein
VRLAAVMEDLDRTHFAGQTHLPPNISGYRKFQKTRRKKEKKKRKKVVQFSPPEEDLPIYSTGYRT